jgi:hypothetical protein
VFDLIDVGLIVIVAILWLFLSATTAVSRTQTVAVQFAWLTVLETKTPEVAREVEDFVTNVESRHGAEVWLGWSKSSLAA